ncbi:MAG: hypothetical protein F6J94_11755 [Moorea sp. SIO1F2]|uniref:hypothetical protein n=1 Tax=unclassified Moorena TaxID=2683338 RepID=UPI0013B62AA0|nr:MULTISPECIES: hypothetical protein [unclassified Moorena]NEP21272.1 hypothetical protein [Moorena sp. SIO3I6]NET82579.1 hypothetical protein [Moorena sp. SIO1F2]
MANRPRYANNLGLLATLREQRLTNLQPWPIGHATRTTFNQPSTLAYWPRYANNV